MNAWLLIAQNILFLLLGAALHAALSGYFSHRKQPRPPSEQPANQPKRADYAARDGLDTPIDPDRTTRADDTSYALVQRLTSLQPDVGDLSQDATIKAPEPVFEVVDTPRESFHFLHIGEVRADWAYAVDTIEAPHPGKPTQKLPSVPASQEHADHSADEPLGAAENAHWSADTGGQPS